MKTSIHRIVIKLNMSSSEVANVVYRTLQPEIEVSQTLKSTLQINIEDNILILTIGSQRIATLRALINSYLRWIKMIRNILMIINNEC